MNNKETQTASSSHHNLKQCKVIIQLKTLVINRLINFLKILKAILNNITDQANNLK